MAALIRLVPLLAVAVFAIVWGARATSAWLPGNELAYTSGGDVLLLDVRSGLLRNLTTGSAFDTSPTWSPDGSELAFISDREDDEFDIYVMAPDGSNMRRIHLSVTPRTSRLDWSPDGAWLAFASYADGDSELYLTPPQMGAPLRQLTFNEGVSDSFPVWSPDGAQIRFSSNRGDGGFFSYYAIRLDDGTVEEQPAFPLLPDWGGHLSRGGWWRVVVDDSDGDAELYLVHRWGWRVRLTDNDVGDYAPAWRP